MKRILSMALVLIMALSLISAVMVSAEETVGTPGKVIVYKQDFEDGTASTWKANNAAQLSASVDSEGNGNQYLKLGSWKADNVARLGATWKQYDGVWMKELKTDGSGKTKDYRIKAEGITGRIADSAQVVYKNGKSYDYTWDGIAKGNGEIKKVAFGSSGINSTIGGGLLSYSTDGKGNENAFITQLYGTGHGWTTPTKQTMKSAAGVDRGNGWWSAGYTGISYPTVKSKTDHTFVDSITINGFFYQCATPVDIIADLLISEKAYCGSGFTDCASFKFTIEADDLYGDEAKVDKTGKVWTAEELCREWNLDEDCTPLYSPQRIADFQAALDEADIQYGIDNVLITADAMLYNDTVTVEGASGATVKAVTNTYTGESQTITNSGTIANVNDYFGTVYTVTTEAGGIKATYNGEAVGVTGANGEFTFTIAPEKITGNGEVEITLLDRVVVWFDDTEDKFGYRAANGGTIFVDTTDGNTAAAYGRWNAKTLVDAYTKLNSKNEMTANLNGVYPRFTYDYKDNSIIIGDTYFYSYDYKYVNKDGDINKSRNQMFINITNSITALPSGWGCYPSLTSESTSNRNQFYITINANPNAETGWRTATREFILPGAETKRGAGDKLAATQLATFQMELKGLTDDGATSLILVDTKKAVDDNTTAGVVDKEGAIADLQAVLDAKDYKILVDNLKFETLTKAVKVNVDAENATVKINGVETADGSFAKVGKGYKSTIKIVADEGCEIKSVKLNGEAQTIGEEGTVEIKSIFDANANLEVVSEPAYVAPSVEVSEYKTATNYAYKVGDIEGVSPYSVIMYGKIAGAPENYGFALSNGEASVKLDAKSIGADGVFAIRVVGGAILPGSYTATPYWTADEETTGEAYTIEIAE